jgi:hypothetical protein
MVPLSTTVAPIRPRESSIARSPTMQRGEKSANRTFRARGFSMPIPTNVCVSCEVLQ